MRRTIDRTSHPGVRTLALCTALLAAACGGAPAVTPTAAPATGAPLGSGPVTGAPDSTTLTTPATGPASVAAPAEVVAGTVFDVSWTGPDGPGDYVTIVKAGADRWTNEDYFDTSTGGNPGTLQAPIDAGAYEIWYVLGTDDVVAGRAPITVTPVSATVEAPAAVDRKATFDVQWTGPDGPGDFITIVEAGALESAYLGYCYTSAGPTCKLTAPDASGAHEVRYVTGANKVLASRPITLR